MRGILSILFTDETGAKVCTKSNGVQVAHLSLVNGTRTISRKTLLLLLAIGNVAKSSATSTRTATCSYDYRLPLLGATRDDCRDLPAHRKYALFVFRLGRARVNRGARYHGKCMNQLHILLTDDQIAALKKLSEKTGASMAELVRRAVDAYIKKNLKA